MASPTSVAIENPEPRRQGAAGFRGTPTAATNVVHAAYSDERLLRSPWLSEAPPTRVLTGVLGEMAFYYGACWLHHRSSTQRRGKAR